MMSIFKKRITLLLTCTLLLLNLCACNQNGKNPVETSEPPVTSTGASPTNVSEPPLTTPEPPPTKISTLLPIDYENAAVEATKLVSSDMWAIDFLINLSVDGKPIYGDLNPGLSEYPVTVPEYKDFGYLQAQLDKIYISNKAYSSFFLYPIFGNPQIFELEGMTYVYPHYFSNFESKIDKGSIEVTELTEHNATFTFNIINHDFFKDGSMSMILTPNGWRLEESFFFYCLKRLDLLDIESTTTWEENPLLDPDQNVGSAKRFIGECMFYNIFIDDLVSSWDAKSIADYYDMQNEAFRYLEWQAALFGHELYCYATDADNALHLKIEADVSGNPDDNSWFDSYLMGTEYGNVNKLLEALQLFADGIYYDNYVLLINLNKQGRSYAIPYSIEEAVVDGNAVGENVVDGNAVDGNAAKENAVEVHVNGDYYAERTVLYYSTDPNYEYFLVSATIAHEILHVFGALDLYYPNDGGDIRKEIIMQYFPFEIMHYIPSYMPEATISAFTAFRVGWRNTLPDQLIMFQAKG